MCKYRLIFARLTASTRSAPFKMIRSKVTAVDWPFHDDADQMDDGPQRGCPPQVIPIKK